MVTLRRRCHPEPMDAARHRPYRGTRNPGPAYHRAKDLAATGHSRLATAPNTAAVNARRGGSVRARQPVPWNIRRGAAPTCTARATRPTPNRTSATHTRGLPVLRPPTPRLALPLPAVSS